MEQFTNRSAIALWITAPALLIAAGVGTYWLIRYGLPQKNPALVVGMICVIWILVLLFTYVALSTGITYVRVERDRKVSIVRRYPHKTVSRILEKDELSPAELIEVRDPEGSDVFTARVKVRDGDEFNLISTTSRDSCEEACWRFNAAVFGSSAWRSAR